MTNENDLAYPSFETRELGHHLGLTKLEAFTTANVAELLSKYGYNKIDELSVANWAIKQAKTTIKTLNSKDWR
jgi:hypothetical protein